MTKEMSEAVILAGGYGRRMGEITRETQKCLLAIDGKPIIGHVLDSLIEAFGSVRVLLCVSFLADQVKEYIDKNKLNGIVVNYLWDNGASRTADLYRGLEGHVSDLFIGLSGDVIAKADAYKSGLEKLQAEKAFALVTLSPKLNEANTHAVGRVNGKRLLSITLPAPEVLNADHLRDMTIWGVSNELFTFARGYQELGAMPVLFQKALDNGRYIIGNVYSDKWVHVASPGDLSKSMLV